jgi:peptidoglycan/LPS O-acetylase OafA/YrhL
MLDGSPFDTFLIPGIILFLILGIFPMIVFYGLWKRTNWAWTGALMVSAALIIWIGVEIWMVGYHPEPPLQLIYGLLGLFLLVLVMMPSVRLTLGRS